MQLQQPAKPASWLCHKTGEAKTKDPAGAGSIHYIRDQFEPNKGASTYTAKTPRATMLGRSMYTRLIVMERIKSSRRQKVKYGIILSLCRF